MGSALSARIQTQLAGQQARTSTRTPQLCEQFTEAMSSEQEATDSSSSGAMGTMPEVDDVTRNIWTAPWTSNSPSVARRAEQDRLSGASTESTKKNYHELDILEKMANKPPTRGVRRQQRTRAQSGRNGRGLVTSGIPTSPRSVGSAVTTATTGARPRRLVTRSGGLVVPGANHDRGPVLPTTLPTTVPKSLPNHQGLPVPPAQGGAPCGQASSTGGGPGVVLACPQCRKDWTSVTAEGKHIVVAPNCRHVFCRPCYMYMRTRGRCVVCNRVMGRRTPQRIIL